MWGAGYTRFSHSQAPTHEVLPKEVRKWRGCGREVERARERDRERKDRERKRERERERERDVAKLV